MAPKLPRNQSFQPSVEPRALPGALFPRSKRILDSLENSVFWNSPLSLFDTAKDGRMKSTGLNMSNLTALALVAFLSAGCIPVAIEAAKKAWEDRSTEDQVTDAKIYGGDPEPFVG